MESEVSEARVSPGSLVLGLATALGFAWVGRWLWKTESQFMGAAVFLMGLGGIVWTAREALGLLKYGTVHLQIDEASPASGLRAVVLFDRGSRSAGMRSLHAALQCKQRSWVSDSGDEGRSVSEQVLWSAQATFPVMRIAGRTQSRIRFELPADARTTTMVPVAGALTTGCYWELSVHSTASGIDFRRSFLVPVLAPLKTS